MKEQTVAPRLEPHGEIFRLLVDAVVDYAIFALDPAGRVLTWNGGAERLKGYKASEIIGQHFSKFYTEHDIARRHPETELKEALAVGKYEEEGWRVKKDGSRFWANVVISRLVDPTGRLLGFAKVTRDLTEDKLAETRLRESEDRLREANENLERRVTERTEDLNRLMRDLEIAVSTRDDFLSIASHELKTPLTSLKLHAQMRMRGLAKPNPPVLTSERFRRMVEDDDKQIDRLNRLVDDMLDITRISSGKLKLELATMDLHETLQEVIGRFASQLEDVGCRLTLASRGETAGVWDAYRIEQVFTNLLTNAMRYGARQPIEVEIERDGDRIRFSVRDHGMGIRPEDQERVFQQFERATYASATNGLGLGLYIVRQIVQAHGGVVQLESVPGEGACFAVELPMKAPLTP